MRETKTLRQRETELQALMASNGGRGELRDIAERYRAAGGRLWAEGTSIITYIIVHEREKGLISD